MTIGLDEARADIAGVLDRVEKREDVLITRDPPSSAEPAERMTMGEILDAIARVRESQPPWSVPSVDLIRQMRHEGY